MKFFVYLKDSLDVNVRLAGTGLHQDIQPIFCGLSGKLPDHRVVCSEPQGMVVRVFLQRIHYVLDALFLVVLSVELQG